MKQLFQSINWYIKQLALAVLVGGQIGRVRNPMQLGMSTTAQVLPSTEQWDESRSFCDSTRLDNRWSSNKRLDFWCQSVWSIVNISFGSFCIVHFHDNCEGEHVLRSANIQHHFNKTIFSITFFAIWTKHARFIGCNAWKRNVSHSWAKYGPSVE